MDRELLRHIDAVRVGYDRGARDLVVVFAHVHFAHLCRETRNGIRSAVDRERQRHEALCGLRFAVIHVFKAVRFDRDLMLFEEHGVDDVQLLVVLGVDHDLRQRAFSAADLVRRPAVEVVSVRNRNAREHRVEVFEHDHGVVRMHGLAARAFGRGIEDRKILLADHVNELRRRIVVAVARGQNDDAVRVDEILRNGQLRAVLMHRTVRRFPADERLAVRTRERAAVQHLERAADAVLRIVGRDRAAALARVVTDRKALFRRIQRKQLDRVVCTRDRRNGIVVQPRAEVERRTVRKPPRNERTAFERRLVDRRDPAARFDVKRDLVRAVRKRAAAGIGSRVIDRAVLDLFPDAVEIQILIRIQISVFKVFDRVAAFAVAPALEQIRRIAERVARGPRDRLRAVRHRIRIGAQQQVEAHVLLDLRRQTEPRIIGHIARVAHKEDIEDLSIVQVDQVPCIRALVLSVAFDPIAFRVIIPVHDGVLSLDEMEAVRTERRAV